MAKEIDPDVARFAAYVREQEQREKSAKRAEREARQQAEEVRVGEHHTLRTTGGAARVQLERDVVGRARGARIGGRLGCGRGEPSSWTG